MKQEPIYCPYCGNEMKLVSFSNFAWRYICKNQMCNAYSAKGISQEEARKKAMNLYRPIQKPMKLKEVRKHIGFVFENNIYKTKNYMATPLYREFADETIIKINNDDLRDKSCLPWCSVDIIADALLATECDRSLYNRVFRFWRREPSNEERIAAKWNWEDKNP